MNRRIIRCVEINIRLKLGKSIGGRDPPALKIDTIGKIAKALKVKPSELLKP